MARFKIQVSVEEPDAITAGLDPTMAAGVVNAQKAEAKAVAELEAVQQRLAAAQERVASLTDAIPEGRASDAELADALRLREVAALTEPGYVKRVAAAKADVEAAERAARQAVVKEAGRRRDELQESANQIRPVLEALRHGEEALDAVLLQMGERKGVAPVDWPMSLDDEGALRNTRQLVSSPAAGR